MAVDSCATGTLIWVRVGERIVEGGQQWTTEEETIALPFHLRAYTASNAVERMINERFRPTREILSRPIWPTQITPPLYGEAAAREGANKHSAAVGLAT